MFSQQGAGIEAAGEWSLAAATAVLVNMISAVLEPSSPILLTLILPNLDKGGACSPSKAFEKLSCEAFLSTFIPQLKNRHRGEGPGRLACCLNGSNQADTAQSSRALIAKVPQGLWRQALLPWFPFSPSPIELNVSPPKLWQ